MKGIVIKSTGSNYLVENAVSGEIVDCKIRGKLRLEGIRTTNPVAVGDIVDFVIDEANDVAVIKSIEKRKN